MENNLKMIREQRNISQTDLAEASGVSRPTIIELESGKKPDVKISTIKRLAESLGVRMSEILP